MRSWLDPKKIPDKLQNQPSLFLSQLLFYYMNWTLAVIKFREYFDRQNRNYNKPNFTCSSNNPNAGAFGMFILTCVNVFWMRDRDVPLRTISTIKAINIIRGQIAKQAYNKSIITSLIEFNSSKVPFHSCYLQTILRIWCNMNDCPWTLRLNHSVFWIVIGLQTYVNHIRRRFTSKPINRL